MMQSQFIYAFQNALSEIRDSIIYDTCGHKRLALFNLESLQIMRSESILPPNVFKEYIEANKEISGLIYYNENFVFDFGRTEVLKFVDNLVGAVEMFPELFVEDGIDARYY